MLNEFCGGNGVNTIFAARRPKFRLLVAIPMVAAIFSGIAAVGLASVVALAAIVDLVRGKEALPRDNENQLDPTSWLRSLGEFPSWESFFVLTGIACVSFVSGYLLRRIVIAGLHE
jgi:hypothetical protein